MAEILFKNSQWQVEEDGMGVTEASGQPGFRIDAERLTDTTDRGPDGIFYDWPVQMAEKEWVNYAGFIQAFEKALDIHAGRYEGVADKSRLARSIHYGQKIKARLRTK